MQDTAQILTTYHEYLEKVISSLESFSDEKIIEKFLQEKEIDKTVDLFQVVRLMRGHIYQSRNISKVILQTIISWNSDQKNFFFDSITSELESLEVVFRGYSHVVPQAKLPTFGTGGLYFLVEGSEVLIVNYKIIQGYLIACQPILNRLDTKIEKEINPSFNSKNAEVDQLIIDLKLYKGEASSRKTKEIYKKKYEDYKRTVEVYELYLMLLVCLSVTLVLGQLFAHGFFDSLNISNAITIKITIVALIVTLFTHGFFDSLNISNAITIKITIVALIVTLFTYCFKQISFYRKISEQAHQTFMELEALPEYLAHLPEDKQHEIRTDLAKCYFGQNLFDSIKEDSVSMQEQAKANAEVLKATAALLDVIKKQSSSPN